MALYELRYFFDAGSGVCLWAANYQARGQFGYPIAGATLGLPESLVRQADELIEQYDAALDWDDPAGPSLYSEARWLQFFDDAMTFLVLLRTSLGSDFDIADRVRMD